MDRYIAEQEEYKGYTIKIIQDDESQNPCKEFDMLGMMVCWHNRYNLGHEYDYDGVSEWLRDKANLYASDPDKLYEMEDSDLWKIVLNNYLVIPLYLYEHGGITMKAGSVGLSWDSFDSGQVGYIYVSHDKIKEEYSVKRLSKKTLEKAANVLKAEVSTYDDYLTGNVWGYTVENINGHMTDSCWGFYGDDGRKEAMSEARSQVDYDVKENEKKLDAMMQRVGA